MSRPSLRRVAVIGADRIPFARLGTVYASLSNKDMLGTALGGLVRRGGVQTRPGLEHCGQGRGLISVCAAGGQGVTAILERDADCATAGRSEGSM